MRKSVKRFLSTILALTMLCSCMAVTNAVSVFAATVGSHTESIDTSGSLDLTTATAYTESDEVEADYEASKTEATLTSNNESKSYADIVIDEDSIISGTVTISGKFTAGANSKWPLISLINSDGDIITGLRTDGDSKDDGGNVIKNYVLGTSTISSGGVDTGVAYNTNEHSFELTVNLDNSTSSLTIDNTTVTGTIAESSEIYGMQLYVSKTTNRSISVSDITVACKGEVNYVYFEVDENEAKDNSYFTITKNGSSVSGLTDQTTVYTGLDFDRDGSVDHIPESGYVIGYRVKGAESGYADAFGISLSETATASE